MNGPVLIMAGGTGGHIFPGLAVADELRQRGIDVAWLGSVDRMEARLVPERGYPFHGLKVGGVRGKGLVTRLRAPFILAGAVMHAWRLLHSLRPRAVLSMGGFAAGPGGLAARLKGIPLVVHEQNSIPGLTNRVLAKLAARVLTGFPDVFERGEFVGNPVRADIAALAPPSERLAGRTPPRRLLVLGGSQGARALNQTVPRALARLPQALRPEVRHQMGDKLLEEGSRAYEESAVKADVVPFIKDMAEALGWADLVVCRAGALTIAEIAAAGVASLLVPYPHAVDDHQTRNAEVLVARGAAELIPEAMMTDTLLASRLEAALDNPGRLMTMAGHARQLARPQAAQRVADVLQEVAS